MGTGQRDVCAEQRRRQPPGCSASLVLFSDITGIVLVLAVMLRSSALGQRQRDQWRLGAAGVPIPRVIALRGDVVMIFVYGRTTRAVRTAGL